MVDTITTINGVSIATIAKINGIELRKISKWNGITPLTNRIFLEGSGVDQNPTIEDTGYSGKSPSTQTNVVNQTPGGYVNNHFLAFTTTTASLIYADSGDFGFGTGDYTVEGWFYHYTGASATNIFEFRTANSPQPHVLYTDVNQKLTYYDGSGTYIYADTNLTLGQWNHIALTRKSGTVRLFLNGTQVGTRNDSSYNLISSRPLRLGAGTAGWKSPNYIDQFRIIKGMSLYNSNFTP